MRAPSDPSGSATFEIKSAERSHTSDTLQTPTAKLFVALALTTRFPCLSLLTEFSQPK